MLHHRKVASRRTAQILIQMIASVILVTFFAIDGAPTSVPASIVHVGGADIEVSFERGDLNLPRNSILGWISKSACAVTEYYGRFPVRHLKIDIVPVEKGQGVVFGRTFVPDRTATIRVMVARSATASDLGEDWIMTHEMVHLAFPQVPREHHWIEEGIATYVEPIARAQVGDLRAEKVWRDLVDGLPHGLPAPGDQGLDHTHTWGRTYWGGALFCTIADVEIHLRTKNKFGLQDALRAIAKNTNMEQEWPLTRALKTGDDATLDARDPLPQERQQVGRRGAGKALRELGEHEKFFLGEPLPTVHEIAAQLCEDRVSAAEAGDAVVDGQAKDRAKGDASAHVAPRTPLEAAGREVRPGKV